MSLPPSTARLSGEREMHALLRVIAGNWAQIPDKGLLHVYLGFCAQFLAPQINIVLNLYLVSVRLFLAKN
jgi:hypothetical protein